MSKLIVLFVISFFVFYVQTASAENKAAKKPIQKIAACDGKDKEACCSLEGEHAEATCEKEHKCKCEEFKDKDEKECKGKAKKECCKIEGEKGEAACEKKNNCTCEDEDD